MEIECFTIVLIAMQTSGPCVFIPLLGIVFGSGVPADAQEVPRLVIRRRRWPLAHLFIHFAGFFRFKEKPRFPVQMDGPRPGWLVEVFRAVQRALVNRKPHMIKVVFVPIALWIIRHMPPDFRSEEPSGKAFANAGGDFHHMKRARPGCIGFRFRVEPTARVNAHIQVRPLFVTVRRCRIVPSFLAGGAIDEGSCEVSLAINFKTMNSTGPGNFVGVLGGLQGACKRAFADIRPVNIALHGVRQRMPGIENTGKASLVILVRCMGNPDSVSGPDYFPRRHRISQCALMRGLPHELPPGVAGCLQRKRVIDTNDSEIARNFRAVVMPGVFDLAHMNRPGPGHFLLILGVENIARMPGFPDHCPVIVVSVHRNRPVVLGKQPIDFGEQIQRTVSGLHRVNTAGRGKAGGVFRVGPGALMNVWA
ncbi:Unknown protein sequence [Pseudomonas syringae pv. maculicola]|nr:Unknown protein sequence [Pseudomonas syringae pv. maculicola]